MKRRTLGTIMLGAALVLATTAAAGSPGKWSTLASGAGLHGSAQQIALARTPDGTLHVAWREGSGSQVVIHTRSISAAGQLGSIATAVAHIPIPSDPALVTTPTGLQLFFGAGVGSSVTGLAVSGSASGTSWSAPSRVVNQAGAAGSTPAVTTAPDGTSFQTWSSTSLAVHRGVTATAPHVISSPVGSQNTRANIAADTNGGIWVVWCRYGGAQMGTIAQRIDPATGAASGSQIQLPGSVTQYQGKPNPDCVLEATIARLEPLVARVGGGVYAAGTAGYPTLSRVLLWRLDASGVTRTLVAGRITSKFQLGLTEPAVAADPAGRIWVAWLDKRPNGTRIVARRSNRAGTVLGAAVTATPPGGLLTGSVDLSAQSAKVDVVVSQQTSAGLMKLVHTQLLPGLTLLRGPVARHGATALVGVRAVDAGEAVSGVRVKIGARSATTNAKGMAQVPVKLTSRKHRVTARAVHTGYVGASVRVLVPAKAH